MMPLSGSVTLADEADAGDADTDVPACPSASRMRRTLPAS
jgi:hypothetical protein